MSSLHEIDVARKCAEYSFIQVFFKERLPFNVGRLIDWLLGQYGDEHAAEILFGVRRYFENQAQFDYEAIKGGE